MNTIPSNFYQFTEALFDRINQNFLAEMKNNRTIEIINFLVANIFFFTVVYAYSNYLDEEWINNPGHGPDLSPLANKVKHVILNGLVGGSVYLFNSLLSHLTGTPLSHSVRIAISLLVIGLRIILNAFPTKSLETI